MSLSARLNDFAGLVKFSHTVFLLPFAASAVVLATAVEPLTWWVGLWTLVALVAARSAAMVMNRVADLRFDAANPRTKDRHLVTGQVSLTQAWLWLVASCLLLVLASGMLNPLALYLSPVALAWVLGYSFTKRFTWLCHLWLGAATALAPVGAWIAVTGAWDWRVLVLALAVAFWVAGFDIIYACQDVDFDRGQGLHSLPAGLGLGSALMISRTLHALALAGFAALIPLFGLGGIYLAGLLLVGVVLVAEQALVAWRQANIPMAFFTLNGIVSIVFFGFLLADRLTG